MTHVVPTTKFACLHRHGDTNDRKFHFELNTVSTHTFQRNINKLNPNTPILRHDFTKTHRLDTPERAPKHSEPSRVRKSNSKPPHGPPEKAHPQQSKFTKRTQHRSRRQPHKNRIPAGPVKYRRARTFGARNCIMRPTIAGSDYRRGSRPCRRRFRTSSRWFQCTFCRW